jgi:hypothetical protein
MFPKHARALLKRLQDVHATTVQLYSAALAQLTTPRHGYRGDTTRQDGTRVWAMFSAAER